MNHHLPIGTSGPSNIQFSQAGNSRRQINQPAITTPVNSDSVPFVGGHPASHGQAHAATNRLQNAEGSGTRRHVTFSLPGNAGTSSGTASLPSRTATASSSASSSSHAMLSQINHDGFMTQSQYRNLLPAQYRHAQVCPVIAMSDALGFVVPFDVIGNPEDGLTMQQVLVHLRRFGIANTQGHLAGGPQMTGDLQRYFTQANFDSAIVEYHWTDNRGGQERAASHFISIRRFGQGANSYWRVSDSRDGTQQNFPAGQDARLAQHLASLYHAGPPGMQLLEIHGLQHGSITNRDQHRVTAAAFRNRTGAYARTVQQATVLPVLDAASVAGLRLLLADPDEVLARDLALMTLNDVIALPEGWTSAMLQEAEIEIVDHDDFTDVDMLDWQFHHPEQMIVPDDAVITTLRHPTGGEWTYTLPAIAEAAQALLDAEATLQQDNPVADFFAGMGPQPIPTPAPIPDGQRFFQLDPQAWESHFAPVTHASDRRQAIMLSHLAGEPVAPSVFAVHATRGGGTLERLLQAAQAGPGRSGTIETFTSADALQRFGGQTPHNVLALEYRSAEEGGRLGTMLLRRDAQQRWLINLPNGNWQVLEQGLPAHLARLWRDPIRDAGHPVRVLSLSDPSQEEIGDEALAGRLRQTHAQMTETDEAFLIHLERTLRRADYPITTQIMGNMRSFMVYVHERQPGMTIAQLDREGRLNEWVTQYVMTPAVNTPDNRRRRTWSGTAPQIAGIRLDRTQQNIRARLNAAIRVLHGEAPHAYQPSDPRTQQRHQSDFNTRATAAYDRAGFFAPERFTNTVRRLERYVAEQETYLLGRTVRPEEVDLSSYAQFDEETFDGFVLAFLDDNYPHRVRGTTGDSVVDPIRGHLSHMFEFSTTGTMTNHTAMTATLGVRGLTAAIRYSGW